MTDAVIDNRWGHWSPKDGPIEEWLTAKAGDWSGTHDEMVDALLALQKLGWLSLDWDADPSDSAPSETPQGGDSGDKQTRRSEH